MIEFAYMVAVKVLANLLCIAAIVFFCAALWAVPWIATRIR